MLSQIIKLGSNLSKTLAKGITDELIGDPKVDSQKAKVKDKIKELEKLLKEKKDKIHKDRYFSIKSKLGTYHSEVSRYTNLDKLKELENSIKEKVEFLKTIKSRK